MKKNNRMYFNTIYEALIGLTVSNLNGDRIDQDEGYMIFSNVVKRLKGEVGGLMFFCGNGASASMAEHMSHDWFQNGKVNTATCAEISYLTAISNDISYDQVYSYRVKRMLSERDMLVGISSSGNSPNIVNAIAAAKENGAFTVSVSGMKSDNKIRKMADLNFYVPLDHYGEVESAHAVLLHSLLDYYLDNYMEGRH